MEKNLEIEYKMLLEEDVFHQLMNDYQGHTYSQTNYYLTSIELSALRYSLRVREKEGHYEMTLKTPAKQGRLEHNLDITKEDLESIQEGHMPDNEIIRLLKSLIHLLLLDVMYLLIQVCYLLMRIIIMV